MPDLLSNSKARRDYHIIETFEAGIVLHGTEVKALRAGKGQIRDAFARVEEKGVFLYNAHIDEYTHGNLLNHDPKASRRLLLHKREIRRLSAVTEQQGLTIVPLRLYWKNRKVKVEIGIGKGKDQRDKRQDLKERAHNREVDRELARFNR